LSSDHQVLEKGQEGDVVVKLPLPPGALPTVWGDHRRYVESYLSQHEGYFHSGDGGYFDQDGYLFIMGRTDDVINVAGHRLSTGEMEEIVASHSAVAECAVIGIEDPDKGQVPVGLLLLKDGINVPDDQLQVELVAMVRRQIGAFANFKRTLVVARLPKTRSGKILRQVMRKIADNKPYEAPATIDDPGILDEIREVLLAGSVGLISLTESE
ncbi:MAG: propionyl-CoA synthetase, partial [bacterium]